MGTRQNRLAEAVLTSTHNLCLEQKYEKYQIFLSENFQFFVVKFSMYLNRRVFVMIGNERPAKTQTSMCIRVSLGAFWTVKDAKFHRVANEISDRTARVCAGWSESSFGAHVRKYVFLRCGSEWRLSLHYKHMMHHAWNVVITWKQ